MIRTYHHGDTTQLAPHFRACEFQCKCGKGHDFQLDGELVENLEQFFTVVPKLFGVSGSIRGSESGAYPLVSDGGIQLMSMNLLLQNSTDPVLWRGPIIASIVKQFWQDIIWDNIDYLFVDMPPGTGDVPLTVFQSLPVDGIIVVTSPQDLALMIVEKAVNMANMQASQTAQTAQILAGQAAEIDGVYNRLKKSNFKISYKNACFYEVIIILVVVVYYSIFLSYSTKQIAVEAITKLLPVLLFEKKFCFVLLPIRNMSLQLTLFHR